jgi:hypothetical protein
LYQIAPSPVTRIFSFTQEAAIPSPLLQNLDFCTKLDVYRERENKPTHRRKNNPQNFQKIPHKEKKKKHLDKIKLECVPEKSKNEERLQKNLVSRETHLKKTTRKLFKKREFRKKKTLENWRSPSNCQIKRKRKYEEERSERRRKICNYLVRNRNVVKILDEIK